MSDVLTFDAWNRAATKRICDNEDRDTARNVRAARKGLLARITLWDDYLADCAAENRTPEAKQF